MPTRRPAEVPPGATELPAMSEDRRTAEEIIPVIEERVVIGTERASTGTVRVRTVTHEEEHAIDEPITITEVEVKRVPVDRWADEPVADRIEGDTRIISVHREEIIVQRRLHVVEEVHVTLRRREERHHEIVRTQQTQVVVERDGTICGE
jgi:stress response protein YsnF